MSIQRKTTLQTANELVSDTVDVNLKERYGTSIDEYMSREHAKEIRKQIEQLRNEFQSIDKNKDSFLTKEELKDFFNKNNPSNEIFDDDYIESVYKLIDKNSDNVITVNEFVESYVLFSEKLKIKNAKLDRILIELDDSMKQERESLEKAKAEEKELGNGLTSNAYLYISVYEAKDLNPSSLISECDAFVTLNFDGQKSQSLVKSSTNNPAWNENFKFSVKNPNSELKIEVYDQTFMGSKLLGFITIQLSSLQNQEKVINWFDLKLDNSNENNGKIHIKLQYIYSLKKYYSDQLKKNKYYHDIIEENLLLTNTLVDLNEKPFGIIYSGKINEYLDSDKIKECDDIIEKMGKGKSVVWAKRAYEEPRGSLTNKITSAITGQGKVTWNKRTQFLMFLYIIITTISLLGRSDFLNFFISFGLLILYFYDKNNEALEYLEPMIYSIGASLGYDIIWFIMEYGDFFIGIDGDLESGVKKFVYILDIFGFIIKLFLIGTLNALKTKKIKESNKIYG